jgi:hypothetical protein
MRSGRKCKIVIYRKISKIVEKSSGVEALSENEDTEQYIRHVIQE